MRLFRTLGLLLAAALLGIPLHAQYVAPYVSLQGYLTTSAGLPAQNATLTFAPSQLFFIAGTQVVVTGSQCGTDVSGQVIGIGNPLQPPRTSAQLTGSVPPGNYYVKFTWYDQFNGQTLASPEVAVQLTATGEINILPPVGTGPPNAAGMDVYIGSTPNGETFQGQTTSTTAQYTQAVAITTNGSPVPIANTSTCRVVANDAGFPTGTGYQVSLSDTSGNSLFSYPEMWQFFGPGSSYNLSQGIPYYHGQVTYPTPILTTPYNHNLQSISGPLALGVPGNYYNLTGVGALGVDTLNPAWGIDVEGAGLLGAINSFTGYLVNGAAGTIGQCLTSDGNYFNTPLSCVTSLPTIYYQTVRYNGSNQTQELTLDVGPGLKANNVLGPPAATEISANGTGSETEVVTAAGAGTSTHCMVWDGFGGAGDSGNTCPSVGQIEVKKLTLGICTTANFAFGTCSMTVPWPVAFADTSYIAVCSLGNPTSAGSTSTAIPNVIAYNTGSITLQIQNGDTTSADATTVSSVACIGIHP